MMEQSPHALLRLYTDEAALEGDQRLFEVVMARAKSERLLGVTVLHGMVGFGRSTRVHDHGLLSHNDPLLIEIVDEESRLRAFAATLHGLHGIGLMTLEKVDVLAGGRESAPQS